MHQVPEVALTWENLNIKDGHGKTVVEYLVETGEIVYMDCHIFAGHWKELMQIYCKSKCHTYALENWMRNFAKETLKAGATNDRNI
jgi:hypothetical protein